MIDCSPLCLMTDCRKKPRPNNSQKWPTISRLFDEHPGQTHNGSGYSERVYSGKNFYQESLLNVFRILIVVLALLLTACGGGSDDNSSSGAGETAEATTAAETATEEPAAAPEVVALKDQIVVIGDSIGAGVGASSNYPAIIQSLTGLPVINVSTPGISAEGGASKAPSLIDRFRPKYLIVLLGTNNAAGAGGGINGAISSLRFVANVANQAGVIPIIGTLPPISRDADQNDAAFAISRGILGIGGARIARIDQAVSLSEISDGLHPNDSGQSKIGSLFAQQVF